MLRRDFIRAILPVTIAPRLLLSQQTDKPATAPPAPVPWELGLNRLTPRPHTEVADGIVEAEERFFTPVQMATLIRLCDVLLPSIGERPGALQAETPIFLDFLIGSSAAARQKMYTGGLNWLDAESRKRYKKTFARADDEEADVLLRPWLRTWMSDHPPTETNADFVNIAHEDIRMATVNSKVWSVDRSAAGQESTGTELYWYPIQPDLHAASPDYMRIPPHVIAAPKAAHTMPAYQR